MKEFKHVITDPMGMHARPAGMLVKAVAGYASKITITAPTGTADARRLMALMKLAAKQGMELTITVDGADEEKVAADVAAAKNATFSFFILLYSILIIISQNNKKVNVAARV